MHGFQLWANLASALKMTAPRYQDIPALAIPGSSTMGWACRVVCGDFWGQKGPVDGVAAEPRYLDVWVPPGKRKVLPVETYRQAFAYIFEGSATFDGASKPFGALREEVVDGEEVVVRDKVGNRSLVVFDRATKSRSRRAKKASASCWSPAAPWEPIAWHGPIVMNTQAEIRKAISELQGGTFIK